MHNTIMNFIKSFSNFGEAVTNCFTGGRCYWFAHILQYRFGGPENCAICYSIIDNHFGCMISGHIYDITGEVTDDYQWNLWDEDLVQNYDPLAINRIYRDCIM